MNAGICLDGYFVWEIPDAFIRIFQMRKLAEYQNGAQNKKADFKFTWSR